MDCRVIVSQLCLYDEKKRGKFYSGEYRQLFNLQHKWNIPPALVSTGRASAAALSSVSDAALQRKRESAGDNAEENTTTDISKPWAPQKD